MFSMAWYGWSLPRSLSLSETRTETRFMPNSLSSVSARSILLQAGRLAEAVEGYETREDVEEVLDLLERTLWEDVDARTRRTVSRWIKGLEHRLETWEEGGDLPWER